MTTHYAHADAPRAVLDRAVESGIRRAPPTPAEVESSERPTVRPERPLEDTSCEWPLAEVPRLFRLGDVIADSYEIRALLGQGGMGQVFEARDLSLRRRVAIKANFPTVASQFSIRTEAQALAAIRHPGVVAVHAVGRHAGVEFMVMEHIAGVTLETHLARSASLQRAPETKAQLVERLDIIIAIGEGLAAIHRAGLAHGDVKPENVLLAASGRIVLTDLGLVRAAMDHECDVRVGTPTYMAPELSFARSSSLDRQLVDLYAFGVLAYHLIAGELPYDADAETDLLLRHLAAPIPKLSDEMCVPDAISDLVAALMAKDPADRPPSMDAVVWQLRAMKTELTRPRSRQRNTAPPPFTVLVVDDEPEIADLVATLIHDVDPNVDVSVASDAEAAMARFRSSPPQLVFLDLNMPKMSGFELFTYLKGTHLAEGTTMVVMSATGSPKDIELLLELGAYEYIPKTDALAARIGRIVKALTRSASTIPLAM